MRSVIATTALILLLMTGGTGAQVYQLRHWSGQGLAPVYEGFDINPDGTYNMWFGYMNRNFEEELDVPVGADNKFEPGTADRGQPTHFDTDGTRMSFASSSRKISATPTSSCGRVTRPREV